MRQLANDAPLIYDIQYLNLPKEYERIAISLLKSCDMPMVFWIGANTTLNTRGRHPAQINQYWVLSRTNTSNNENNRLILAGICANIQERKRYLQVCPNPAYEKKLKKSRDSTHVKAYYDFLRAIYSVAASLDIECFLEANGICTESEAIQASFVSHIKKLTEYQKLQSKKKSCYTSRWYREMRLHNLLSYATFYRRSADYRLTITRLLNQINPKYIKTVKTVSQIIQQYKQENSGSNGEELHEQLLRNLVYALHAEDIVCYCYPDVFSGEYPISPEIYAPVYSYVPSDLTNQSALLRWMRMSRELICSYRQSTWYEAPDVMVNLIDSDIVNAYADGSLTSGYCISFTKGLIEACHYYIANWKYSDHFAKYPYDDVNYHLLRQVVFIITAHEYAHILNGDCNDTRHSFLPSSNGENIVERLQKEASADEKANNIVSDAEMLCYRFPPEAENDEEKAMHAEMLMLKIKRDEIFHKEAKLFLRDLQMIF